MRCRKRHASKPLLIGIPPPPRKNGRLEISNNLAERSIKPFVMDRKNYLFTNTPKDARARAGNFSIIQTAIENGLDPYRYMAFLFSEAPRMASAYSKLVEKPLSQNAPDKYNRNNTHYIEIVKGRIYV